MNEIMNTDVKNTLGNYPDWAQNKLLFIRELILEVASEINGTPEVEETLKWGEPSYLTEQGSTIRMDWKKAAPTQYALYFNCNTRLIETFREVFQDQFKYEGNRAIVFDKEDDIPIRDLKRCIETALTYKERKHLPLLGI
ncbi:DUF1801 domain-containing protein [Marinilactibacillus psychrotolerans]|uniref:DUF1801 domain-containing protein n=1 Tax=Marinilactibacillus psychrotolerans TaxID=191770 RepID=UPI00388613A0